ncbi:MAG: group 1 truncated hemoglobin [Alphaproteobacteria bacterium]|nr:group 1 truncated hemoglobin [Alphaproteobacteria bacterium]
MGERLLPATGSDYERVGGEPGLRRIFTDLLARMGADFVIGYLFAGRDVARIIEMEVSLAASHLGGPERYAGRSVARVHGPLRINRGHFRRRMAFLRTTLRDHGVDEDIIARWVAHDLRLEPAVTDGTDCAQEPA